MYIGNSFYFYFHNYSLTYYHCAIYSCGSESLNIAVKYFSALAINDQTNEKLAGNTGETDEVRDCKLVGV